MNQDNPTVIVYAKRTAVGKMSGAFASVPAPRLGAALVKDALQNSNIKGEEVDEIIMGNVLTSGVGQAPARQTALYGGLPHSVCATTVGRVCGSGLKAVMLADQAIRLGDARIVFAGGQENMTLAPHLLMNARAGYRFGSVEAKDSMQWDGLWDPYNDVAMGNCGEICAKEYKFSREDQDGFALESYTRARKAVESGVFAEEIVPVEVKQRKQTVTVEVDEEPFSVDLDKLPALRPAFDKEGSVTAGNASSINDGAALLVMTDLKTAQEKGLTPIARVVGQASFAHDPAHFTTAPIGCIKRLLKKTELSKDDIDLWEINEAFAVVTMAAMKDIGIDARKVNIHGGAVSIGHPIGCSGARILVTLLNALKQTGGKRGLATLCIGGGEASGVIVEMM
ncbi:thiolase family protein [Pseudobacteriovorax antillogorgiicola]|uniref:Acetyl-CoA C-acetyltransferase n=1 Tax=Pseudobacteriovorax antillogorgiicola TaxID=1513793 RepID=A0A1Y6CKY1_9BACT|nr:thiolase family protein [Pseudobacteriovorax antillogorgiicola]TCS45657.1 acetyl-CoA C-acetyltransferase [Pseudobacteriovorax antillogorgiicola]SMF72944.1 acetyl-CoA C-acetyltransferase [Pseudobacteriovorax antillogorgiicola]